MMTPFEIDINEYGKPIAIHLGYYMVDQEKRMTNLDSDYVFLMNRGVDIYTLPYPEGHKCIKGFISNRLRRLM